jgi:hypothetical protein
MNDLTNPKPLAMDSREIAELLDARHGDLLISIETQLLKVGYTGKPLTYKNAQNGQTYRYYMLPYRETMILISGYSVELRAKIIDRWMQLEQQGKQPVFTDPIILLRLEQMKTEQRLSQVEAIVDYTSDHMTVKGYCSINGIPCDKESAKTMGKLVAKYCRLHDIEVKKISDPVWGEVGMYPMTALDKCLGK